MPVRLPKGSLGFTGEIQARAFLEKKGYQFLAHNFTTPFGEIDLIFHFHHELVFVEVKAKSSHKLGRPEEMVTATKLAKITRVADYFMQTHPKLPQSGRIEVVAITGKQVEHYIV